MDQLIKSLKVDFPDISFNKGRTFSWSPKTLTVTYINKDAAEASLWALLHEIAHAALMHQTYDSDLELLLLEAEAWAKANEIAEKYEITIPEDHVQDCLDTYRDWLHKRSACPVCGNQSLQASRAHYECYNCGNSWQVSSDRFCRPYRKQVNK